jgi:indole-3-glycerol phosphate synthase
MPENIFTRIIENKKNKINILKKSISTDEINERIKQQTKFINFKEKIKKNTNLNKTSIIAEIKKASPSAGIIIEDYNPIEIAKIYQLNKATCLSILTEEDFFLGNLIHVSKVKQKIDLPILCKDFFIDKFQIPLSKSYGSDAILIILAGVNDKSAMELYEEALKYNLTVIVEVHTIEEAKRALRFKDAIIGINNRNLKTLITDLNTTYEINNILLNHSEPIISESGIRTKDDIIEIQNKTNIKTFLIGESLLKNLKENSIFSLL